MVEIFDNYAENLLGGYFSTYKKNFGNKLFIYSVSRLIADKLGYNLIVPQRALIRREELSVGTYVEQFFPFESITDRISVDSQPVVIDDTTVLFYDTVDKLVKLSKGKKVISMSYFSKYDYIKPYKNEVRNFLSKLKTEKRKSNDLVLMLRNSRDDGRFVLPDDYYLNLIEKESFDNLYVSFDHIYQHSSILEKLSKYEPRFIEGSILDVFKELTSFDKIIACQGTFSFWVCFLSDASKIYWPITNDGPNSNNIHFKQHVNLRVDDEERYKFINVDNIYSK
jgi:hypothetical protein